MLVFLLILAILGLFVTIGTILDIAYPIRPYQAKHAYQAKHTYYAKHANRTYVVKRVYRDVSGYVVYMVKK